MQESVYEKFLVLLLEKVKSAPIGDGFDDEVTNGPIVSERVVPRYIVVLRKSLIDLKNPIR